MIADAHNTGLGEAQQTRILELLDTSEQQTPIVAALRDAVAEAPTAPAAPNPYQRLKARLAARYERIAVSRLFVRTVITFSIISLVFSLPALAVLMGVAIAERSLPESTAVSLTAVASALVTTATLIGIVQLVRRRRISGLEWLRTSMALSILIAAPVEFWTQELTALPAFILTLLAYGALGYAINRERERDDASPSG
jgi:hypothetical protein